MDSMTLPVKNKPTKTINKTTASLIKRNPHCEGLEVKRLLPEEVDDLRELGLRRQQVFG